MKKYIKGLVLIFILLISFLFSPPQSVLAASKQSSYIDIYSRNYSFVVEDLSFLNIAFSNYSLTSTKNFGITGIVVNESQDAINYKITINYYDSDHNLLIQKSSDGLANVGTTDLNLMTNSSDLSDVDEILYYRLIVEYESKVDESVPPSENPQYKSFDYVIDKYDVNIVVNENNTLDVKETITAYFNTPKHGIYRTIPLKNKITRLDGTSSMNRTQIYNLKVNEEYTTSRENDNYKIKIGSANETLTGEKTYVIEYTYNLGKDPMPDYDELYYNIIGTDWDTIIGNVTFTIKMPMDFDSSKLGFSSGPEGSTSHENIKYRVNGRTITGSYNGILGVGEGLTIRSEFEEGYFVNTGLRFNIVEYLPFLVPVLFLLISIILWYKFGRDDPVIETVEFYPPKGFNSLEVGFLYKGTATSQDVVSLLIYLANKGYIKISEIEGKYLFSKAKDFKITKLKDYDGDNASERLFLNGLFKNHAASSDDTEISVTQAELCNSFYLTVREILANMNSKQNKNKIIEKSSTGKSIFIILMMIASYCLITIPPVMTYGFAGTLIFALLFPSIGFGIMFLGLFGSPYKLYGSSSGAVSLASKITKIFLIIWGIMFGGMPWLIIVLPTLLQDVIYLYFYNLGLGCIVGMLICLINISKRTKYGNKILGQLRGFKNFLETAEKDKLESMVTKNPTYFYDILPYTYVLGVSDTWIKKFETIALEAPTWYDSPSAFDVLSFGSFINSTIVSAQVAMMSSPSSDSSSGGGSSGGGSSGGGSGGGGGGSW